MPEFTFNTATLETVMEEIASSAVPVIIVRAAQLAGSKSYITTEGGPSSTVKVDDDSIL